MTSFKYSKYIINVSPLALSEIIKHTRAEIEESGPKTALDLWDRIASSGFSHYLLRQILYYTPFETTVSIGQYEKPADGSQYAPQVYDESE